MKEDGLGRLFVRHLVMAVPWGIMLLLVFFIAQSSLKQQVKEGIEYGIVRAAEETASLAFDYDIVTKVKKNVKEGVEFIAKTGRNEMKNILNDPQVKQDLKEAFEYDGKKLRK